ncbi:hypothetical protein GGS21DRAFT_520948, partial [Xylaria nigripes]
MSRFIFRQFGLLVMRFWIQSVRLRHVSRVSTLLNSWSFSSTDSQNTVLTKTHISVFLVQDGMICVHRLTQLGGVHEC